MYTLLQSGMIGRRNDEICDRIDPVTGEAIWTALNMEGWTVPTGSPPIRRFIEEIEEDNWPIGSMNSMDPAADWVMPVNSARREMTVGEMMDPSATYPFVELKDDSLVVMESSWIWDPGVARWRKALRYEIGQIWGAVKKQYSRQSGMCCHVSDAPILPNTSDEETPASRRDLTQKESKQSTPPDDFDVICNLSHEVRKCDWLWNTKYRVWERASLMYLGQELRDLYEKRYSHCCCHMSDTPDYNEAEDIDEEEKEDEDTKPNPGIEVIHTPVLPCPFCGELPIVGNFMDANGKHVSVIVECFNYECPVRPRTFLLRDELPKLALRTLQLWNDRHIDPKTMRMYEALVSCLAYIERDETAHGRNFGAGNAARDAIKEFTEGKV